MRYQSFFIITASTLCLLAYNGCEKDRPLSLPEDKPDWQISVLSSKEDDWYQNDRTSEIDSLLSLYKLADPLRSPFWEKQLEKSFIQKAEELLQQADARLSKDFRIFLHHRLGVVYGARTIQKFEKAILHLKQAEAFCLDDPIRYRLRLGMVYDWLAIVYMGMGKPDLAMPLWKKLANDYQGIGSGKLKNMIAVNSVFSIARHYIQVKKDTAGLEGYLTNLATEQGWNDVGYAAKAELYKLNKLRGDEVKAQRYLEQLNLFPETWQTQRIAANVKRFQEVIEQRKKLEKKQ